MTEFPVTLIARGILFDMDGTLVDSTAVVEATWAVFADDYGLDVRDVLAVSHGRQGVDTVRQFAPAGTDHDAVAQALIVFEMESTEMSLPIRGAAELLASLPAESVGLVTSAPGDLARIRIRAAGLEVPAVAVFSNDVVNGKPAPDCYLLGAERLGLDPADVIVFEDAPAGLQAGIAAGMRTIAVGGVGGDVADNLIRINDYSGVSVELGTDATGATVIALTIQG